MGKGSSGAVRVEDGNGGSTLTYGRQFSADSGSLYSSITRETINALKAHFRDQVRKIICYIGVRVACYFVFLVRSEPAAMFMDLRRRSGRETLLAFSGTLMDEG